MDKYTAIGIGVGVAATAAIGYIIYKNFLTQATTTSTQQQGLTQATTTSTSTSTQQQGQGIPVNIFNACYENVTITITTPDGNKQTIQLTPGMNTTINVSPGSTISATDNVGNQIMSPYTIPNENATISLTLCPSNVKTVEVVGQGWSTVRQGATLTITSPGTGRRTFYIE